MSSPETPGVRVRLFALFGLAFLGVYGSADLIASWHGWRWPISPSSWPFWPAWAWVYLSLDLMLPLTFWRLSARRMGGLTAALIASTLTAWPLFVLFPLPDIGVGADPSLAYTWADRLNLKANHFPSLHVAYALICAAFWSTPWSWTWGAAIAFSTLVTRQHYTIDVVAGAVLAAGAVRWANGPGRVESLCLAELARCAARHRRYALIGFALYAASALAPRRRRLARVGFCYLQRLDDLLDGHLGCAEEPEEMASSQQRALRGERDFQVGEELETLGQALLEELKLRGQGLGWAIAVIEEMKLDRRRVRESRLLSQAELDEHLQRTFALSLDLMLLAADSPLRWSDVPHLVLALGWCSVVRDWDEDRALGLINVPHEVSDVESWRRQQRETARQNLVRARAELEALRGRPGHRLLEIFLRSVEGYARREGGGA